MTTESGRRPAVNLEDVASATGPVNARRSLADDVYTRLVELLMREDIEPGQRLAIDALARAWGVSPTPLREAMARAEESGLVTREPLKGYAVAPMLTMEEFDQLMSMRMLIEPYCAARACASVDGHAIDKLAHYTELMELSPKGPTSDSYRDYMSADISFHDLIAVMSGNRFLRTALSGASAHAHRFRRFGHGTVTDSTETVREHTAILDALRRRDSTAASAAMHTHLLGVDQRARVV